MNPALIIIVPLALAVLWFLSSFMFRPLGKFISKVYRDAIDDMNQEDNKSDMEEK